MSPSKRKIWNLAQKAHKNGGLKQELCFWLLYGTNVMQTKGKGLPPSEATVQLREESSPDTGLEQWVKTLIFNKGENKT